MAKIYTKVGDKGSTSLLGGQKVPKDDDRIAAYGTVDELNSVLGWARSALDAAARAPGAPAVERLATLNADLENIQHWLFDLGGLLASNREDRAKFKLAAFTPERVSWLESRIDAATAVLPPLKEFILPGGSEAASRLHVARTVARRAERRMIGLGEHIPENAIPFINRLSDYLFTVARWVNHKLGVADVVWKKAGTGE